jgi:hypothetical protein
MQACGIEVSAKDLVVAFTGEKGEALVERLANNSAGHQKLLQMLTRCAPRVSICMEATGISKVGNRHLRYALYMPALVASRRELHLRGSMNTCWHGAKENARR